MRQLQRFAYRLRHWLRPPAAAALAPLLACWRAEGNLAQLDWRRAELLVVDAEMSSLQVAAGELLSVGWVVIAGGEIQLHSARHLLLKPEQGVGDSATVHHLRDCELEQGIELESLMQQFLQAAAGRALVFHHAPLDLAFLDRSSRRLYGAPLLLPVIDTLQLEKRRLQRSHAPLVPNSLRLASCRARYNLPDYPAHNALVDALATAELLLAQLAHKGGAIRVGALLG